ncbi:MAG TPA: hypothetical protein VN031_00635 [Candidatus Microsaccharimonas sp.]|nr:hypothetical protein [Candidatus Microsaccharimonas sp.]
MATTVKLPQTRALGGYALRRTQFNEWFGTRRKQTGTSTKSQSDPHKDKDDGSTNGKDARRLRSVVRESHTILIKARAVFPFQLFPDYLNIDRHKLTIIHRQFWGIEQTVSVPIENIKNVEADFGPFFGSITVTSDLFINNTQTVHFLWRHEAKNIQKLLQGAIVAQREGIDLSKIEIKQLRKMLVDLGSGHTKSMRR